MAKAVTPFFPEPRKAGKTLRAKVWLKDKGVCYRCKRPVAVGEKWDCEHKKALADGGTNDIENLFVCHRVCHTEKSAEDAKARVKPRRLYKKHNGIIEPKRTIQSPGFVKSKKKSLDKLPIPPRRNLFIMEKKP